MNERVIAIVVFAVASVMLFLDVRISIVLLSIGGLLIAYWIYLDDECRQQDLEYLGAKVGKVEQYFDARQVSAMQDRKNAWVCPACKAVNPNEVSICHQCKRLKPT